MSNNQQRQAEGERQEDRDGTDTEVVCSPCRHDGRLPRQYTLEGQGAKKDISPPLEWYGVPGGTRSLALVVQDIDADERVPWMHLVVANKSPEEKGLPEGFLGAGGNANTGGEGGLQEGVNDRSRWRGPVRTPKATASIQLWRSATCSASATRQVRPQDPVVVALF
ncbi:hypothetical protein ZWY2020_028934 [Hordeum vulgare]|nr:hypothetical protein ZWY2020_028934 [Hordeum vulgare]